MQQIVIIVPTHNESDNVGLIYRELVTVFRSLPSIDFKLLFIDDGSTDDTFEKVSALSDEDARVGCLKFSRNFGHQIALKAGIDHFKGDALIMMDADLQHPPSLIPQMIMNWQSGYKVVGTLREDDECIGFVKRFTSRLFYKLINFLSDVPIQPNTADFRLLDKEVVKVLADMPEQDLFIRGLIPWIGGKQVYLRFKAGVRNAGETSYSFRKMLRLAVDGVVSFSTVPLRLAVYLGFLFSTLSLLYLPYIVYSYWRGVAVSGWSSILASVVFFGGLQLVVLGLIGTYLGKIFKQSKARPLYVVDQKRYPMILLSFDVEEFDVPAVEYDADFSFTHQMDYTIRGTYALLELLTKKQIKVTFFITANFAQNAPDVVNKMVSNGHEIASHGYYHSCFEPQDYLRSKEVLETISGSEVIGFRMARMMPVDYALQKRAGYRYDSSLNPTFLPGRYNHFSAPSTYFKNKYLTLLPASVSRLIRFPLFWLSFHNLPWWLYQYIARDTYNKDGYLNIYFHPWEFVSLQDKRLNLPFYFRKKSGQQMLQELSHFIETFKGRGICFYDYFRFFSTKRNVVMSQIMAIDYGTKKTGIAITDDLQLIASPFKTIATHRLMSFLMEYCKQNKVSCLVVGRPLQTDGTPSRVESHIVGFIAKATKAIPDLIVERVDERYTSKMAFQSMIEGGLSKKKRQDKTLVDKVSATIILQTYLEQRKNR